MNLRNLDHRDIWIRATKTFAQSFIAALSLSDLTKVNLSDGKQLLLAAIAAGLSAATNYLIQIVTT